MVEQWLRHRRFFQNLNLPASNPDQSGSEPNAFADMQSLGIPSSEFRVPNLKGPSCRKRLRHLTPALSPFEAEREEARTTALSFALWLRKMS